MYDLIIIGSGPAGLGAAIYGKRAGLDTLVLEKNPMSGGQVLNTYEVDNYLGMPGINGFEMGMQFREHADRLGAEFLETDVTGISVDGTKRLVHTKKEVLEAKAVIVATGAVHKKLGAPGEERLAGRGISYCATCDGAFYRGKTVAVVGGGDVAVEDAIFLARSCEKVYLIHRRDELRAAKRLQEQLFALPNVELIWNTEVEEIQGDEVVSGFRYLQRRCGNGWQRLPDRRRGLRNLCARHFCGRRCAHQKAAPDHHRGGRRSECGGCGAGVFPGRMTTVVIVHTDLRVCRSERMRM